MNPSVSLGELHAAYKRTSSRIYRILEDGYDFAVDEAIIEALDRDALIIDAAFFVLIFGQIENRISEMAAGKMTTERQRRALREQKFEKRMGLASPGTAYVAIREEIAGWYDLRSDAALGRHLARYNIAAAFDRAARLDTMSRDLSERHGVDSH